MFHKFWKTALAIAVLGITFSCARAEKQIDIRENTVPLIKAGVFKQGKTVTFIFKTDDPSITNVSLVGDFNKWDGKATPLVKQNDNWQIMLTLDYGIYQYKYLLNNTNLMADPNAEAYVPDSAGGRNSVIEIRME